MTDDENPQTHGPIPEPHEDASEEQMPTPLVPRLLSAIRGTGRLRPGRWLANKWIRGAVVLVIVLFLVAVARLGVAHVRENEVGVLVNNVTGDLELRERVGYHVFVPYLNQLYVLDKTIQRLDLGWRQGLGNVGRDLKLKTADGSNVSLDVVINFKLIPQKAAEVLRRSGLGMRFAETWIEPFARHICFSSFGQLTTEQVYDAAKRNEKAQAALKEMNARLGPYGIEVLTVIPGEFRFYKEYEQVIQKKKMADQQVEEQQAQAHAALADQETQLVEANKKAETQLASFEGECANRLIQAKAEADKVKREADGRYAASLLAADASLYSAAKQAMGQKATMLAEAEGMEQMRKAMTGDGGLSMVGMEYARHLSHIRFSATPITKEPSIHQFAMQPGEVAATAAAAGQSQSARHEPTAPSGSETAPPRSPPRPAQSNAPQGGAR